MQQVLREASCFFRPNQITTELLAAVVNRHLQVAVLEGARERPTSAGDSHRARVEHELDTILPYSKRNERGRGREAGEQQISTVVFFSPQSQQVAERSRKRLATQKQNKFVLICCSPQSQQVAVRGRKHLATQNKTQQTSGKHELASSIRVARISRKCGGPARHAENTQTKTRLPTTQHLLTVLLTLRDLDIAGVQKLLHHLEELRERKHARSVYSKLAHTLGRVWRRGCGCCARSRSQVATHGARRFRVGQ